MRLADGRLAFSATDLVNHLQCKHLTGLERAAASGERERVHYRDEAAELVAKHGMAHERRHHASLVAAGRAIVEIEGSSEEERATATDQAMRGGADVIYQATFIDGDWTGRADFLERVDGPSGLGAFSYEVYDTKLARSAKASALVQLAEYSHQVAKIQGCEPKNVHLVLGDGSTESFPLADIAPYHRSVRRAFEADLGTDLLATYPEPIEHCSRCSWRAECSRRRIDDDHLSLIADLGRTQARRLVDAGITTATQLAELADGSKVLGMQPATLERLQHQARLQIGYRKTGKHTFELLVPSAPNVGLEAMPEPSGADLFLDIEGDAFLGVRGLEYLFGFTDLSGTYEQRWATSVGEEKEVFESVIDEITTRLEAEPGMHVYHFGHYEPTTLKRLAAQHGTREHELDQLLRKEVFVDLHRIVRRALRASVDSYSIKRLETFYRAPRDTAVTSGIASAVRFEEWLASDDHDDRGPLDEIAEYNRDDCESARELRQWLEALRPQLEAQLGRTLVRPEPVVVDRAEAVLEIDAEVEQLQGRLLHGVPADPADQTEDQHSRWLMAHLLVWHRREARTEWWAYFDRRDLEDDERVAHSECLAGLELESSEEKPGKLLWHTYRFDPSQELKIRKDDQLVDPETEKAAGTVKELDSESGTLVLSRRASSEAPHPRSLMVGTPPSYREQERALRAMATAVLDGDPQFLVGRRLLRRMAPAVDHDPKGDVVAKACARALALDGDFLAIQGPPGAGKSYTGSHIANALADARRTVGICANSHAVINNLLRTIAQDFPHIRILKKGPPVAGLPEDTSTQNYKTIVAKLDGDEVDIIAGTSFAFCRDELAGRLDTLIVDEAGQMSLANVLAVSQAARNLILLGDPQQLSQPTKAAHPPGTNLSALAHILAGEDTMPAGMGMFLPESRRMHPTVCRFISDAFYESRLESHETCATQALDGLGLGLRLRLVEHAGRSSQSPEEVESVASLIDALVGATWIDREGQERPLTIDDVLVVTPYNAQVRALRGRLSEARVGTVDLFQGQEAPVVMFSMSASSADLAPRGMAFLYDLNRLNVAISRAQGAAVIVCSPELLVPPCRTPADVRRASALCRFAELALPA